MPQHNKSKIFAKFKSIVEDPDKNNGPVKNCCCQWSSSLHIRQIHKFFTWFHFFLAVRIVTVVGAAFVVCLTIKLHTTFRIFFCLSVVMPLENRKLKKEVLQLMLNAQTYPGRDTCSYWVLLFSLFYAPWSVVEDSRKKASSFFCVCLFQWLIKCHSLWSVYIEFVLKLIFQTAQ